MQAFHDNKFLIKEVSNFKAKVEMFRLNIFYSNFVFRKLKD